MAELLYCICTILHSNSPRLFLESAMLTMTWLQQHWWQQHEQGARDSPTQTILNLCELRAWSLSSSADRALCSETLFLLAGREGSKVPHLYLPLLINDISSSPCSLALFSPLTCSSPLPSSAHFHKDTPRRSSGLIVDDSTLGAPKQTVTRADLLVVREIRLVRIRAYDMMRIKTRSHQKKITKV